MLITIKVELLQLTLKCILSFMQKVFGNVMNRRRYVITTLKQTLSYLIAHTYMQITYIMCICVCKLSLS